MILDRLIEPSMFVGYMPYFNTFWHKCELKTGIFTDIIVGARHAVPLQQTCSALSLEVT